MNQGKAKNIAVALLKPTGIHINGSEPWDIQVHNDNLYARVLREGPLGLGESYMDGWWDCEHLDLFFERVLQTNIENKIKKNKGLLLKLLLLKIINGQTRKKSKVVGDKHYDLGNNLFQAMLDKEMNYTCGYWKEADNLENAQLKKLELTCQKLALKSGMRLLDIGCGFGAFAKYAAEKFGVEVVGITISKQQYDFAVKNCSGLPIKILLQDYRDVQGTFDRIVSLGMFEHVGHLNYLTYMKVVQRCLAENGLFLLHTIGENVSGVSTNEWIAKYIFPHGMLPSITQIGKAHEGIFVMEDWHNFGAYYDNTLMAWHANFNRHWPSLKKEYDNRFYRMWNYYLLSCAGGFRARYIQLWQIVFSKKGIQGGYQAPR